MADRARDVERLPVVVAGGTVAAALRRQDAELPERRRFDSPVADLAGEDERFLDVRLRRGVIALELERARPVDPRRQGGATLAGSVGPRDRARRRRRRARIVADGECQRRAKAGGTGTHRIVVEPIGGVLDRRDVVGLLAASAGDAVDGDSRLEEREAGRRVVLMNQGESTAEVVEGRGVDVAARRVFARLAQVGQRVVDVAGPLVVIGDQAEVLARAIAAADDEPVGGQPMLLAPRCA